MEVFFIKYRKILLAASVFMFFCFFYEMYDGIESFTSSGTGNTGKVGEGIGTLINAGISLFCSIYFFTNVRKANEKFKEENLARDQNSDRTIEL